MTELWIEVAKLAGAGLGSTALWQFVSAVIKRRSPAERLQGQVMTWADELQADAREARQDAEAARKAAKTARAEAVEAERIHREIRDNSREIQDESQRLYRFLTWVLHEIHEPGMTLERLRATVPQTYPPLKAGRE